MTRASSGSADSFDPSSNRKSISFHSHKVGLATDDNSIKPKRTSPVGGLGLEQVANQQRLARPMSLSSYTEHYSCYSGVMDDLMTTQLPYAAEVDAHPSALRYLEEKPVICTAQRGCRAEARKLQSPAVLA